MLQHNKTRTTNKHEQAGKSAALLRSLRDFRSQTVAHVDRGWPMNAAENFSSPKAEVWVGNETNKPNTATDKALLVLFA